MVVRLMDKWDLLKRIYNESNGDNQIFLLFRKNGGSRKKCVEVPYRIEKVCEDPRESRPSHIIVSPLSNPDKKFSIAAGTFTSGAQCGPRFVPL
jgi:hypothetical protein